MNNQPFIEQNKRLIFDLKIIIYILLYLLLKMERICEKLINPNLYKNIYIFSKKFEFF